MGGLSRDEGIKNGIRAKVSSYTRHHVNVMMTKSKASGNYINSVLAKTEVKKAGYDEAIMLDAEGYVSEASGENIFIVRDRKLKTTPLTSILPGSPGFHSGRRSRQRLRSGRRALYS